MCGVLVPFISLELIKPKHFKFNILVTWSGFIHKWEYVMRVKWNKMCFKGPLSERVNAFDKLSTRRMECAEIVNKLDANQHTGLIMLCPHYTADLPSRKWTVYRDKRPIIIPCLSQSMFSLYFNLTNYTALIYPAMLLTAYLFYNTLSGAMGEISNFYNFSPRLFIFGTHIPPILTIHVAKFNWFF